MTQTIERTGIINPDAKPALTAPKLVGDHGNIFRRSLDQLYGGVLLVVEAHPDDGTTSHGIQEYLAKELKMTRYAIVGTNGDAGQDFRSPNRVVPTEYLGKERREESRAAFDVLGYEGAFYLNLSDGGIRYNTQTILDLRRIILGLRPAAMIRTSSDPREDSDHIMMSLMAEKAKWLSAAGHLEGEEKPHYIPIDLESEMMHLGIERYPLVIDTSHYSLRKRDHWRQYRSQAPNPHIDAHFPKLAEIRSGMVGQGVKDAEAYALRDGIATFSIDLEELRIFENAAKNYQPRFEYESFNSASRKRILSDF